MKPKYTRNLTRMQFFKSADYYNMSKVYEDLYIKSSKNIKKMGKIIKKLHLFINAHFFFIFIDLLTWYDLVLNKVDHHDKR